MRFMLILSAVALLATSYGCSNVSTVERASLTPTVAREEYVRLHPQCPHKSCIMQGEIVRGMSSHEVVASWGLPNVYVVMRKSPTEQWIYYIKDLDSLAMLIYTLGFDDDTLRVWNVDEKRDVSQGTVSSTSGALQLPATSGHGLNRK